MWIVMLSYHADDRRPIMDTECFGPFNDKDSARDAAETLIFSKANRVVSLHEVKPFTGQGASDG